MFSFHKPKVYRSTAGCCICKAKSSSSRFTDSKKYEIDFIQCFQLEVPRRGEICNACVLLVKRFKRLPPGSNRHWGHVVDARTGPGLKSMTKFKKRKEEQEAGVKIVVASSVTERFSKLFKKTKKKEKPYKKETSSIGGSSDDSPPSPTESVHSDEYDETIFGKKFFNYATRANQKRQKVVVKQRRRRKNPRPTKNLHWPANHFNLFADVVNDEQWRQRDTCCGLVYECAELQAIIVDASSFKPCSQHQAPTREPQQIITKTSELLQQPTAIKKHQLFLKRHEHPSVTQCDIVIRNSLMETSNKNKTDPMETTMTTTTMMMDGDELMKPFDKLRRMNDIKMGLSDDTATFINENAFGSKDMQSEKFLHKLNTDSVKISKPSSLFNNPLSASLKFKLANIVKCGTLGNDNSSDSGYEEVQDGSKLMIAQMPPPDVLQSL